MTVAGTRPAPPSLLPAPASRTFILSFDFEDWHQLAYLRRGREDWREGSADFLGHVRTVLDLLDELDVHATFFVLGATAARHPSALREVVVRGHELACHGDGHRRVDAQTPEEFRDDVTRCLDVVTEICGVTPVGYRAPWFSITRETPWAQEVLTDLGFVYDSSLFDSPLQRARLRPIPAQPFRVGGLWEFPIAAWKRRGVVLPLGGGSYWRVLPAAALRLGLERVARDAQFPVLYFHPYEFAPERLQVALPERPTLAQRRRETWRRAYRNARRQVIALRFREAAEHFRLVSFRDAFADHTP